MAGAFGVRTTLVAAGQECVFYLSRSRGLCEGLQEGNDRVRLLWRQLRSGGTVGLEGFEWRLESPLGSF